MAQAEHINQVMVVKGVGHGRLAGASATGVEDLSVTSPSGHVLVLTGHMVTGEGEHEEMALTLAVPDEVLLLLVKNAANVAQARGGTAARRFFIAAKAFINSF